jgi:hypothetical protein
MLNSVALSYCNVSSFLVIASIAPHRTLQFGIGQADVHATVVSGDSHRLFASSLSGLDELHPLRRLTADLGHLRQLREWEKWLGSCVPDDWETRINNTRQGGEPRYSKACKIGRRQCDLACQKLTSYSSFSGSSSTTPLWSNDLGGLIFTTFDSPLPQPGERCNIASLSRFQSVDRSGCSKRLRT